MFWIFLWMDFQNLSSLLLFHGAQCPESIFDMITLQRRNRQPKKLYKHLRICLPLFLFMFSWLPFVAWLLLRYFLMKMACKILRPTDHSILVPLQWKYFPGENIGSVCFSIWCQHFRVCTYHTIQMSCITICHFYWFQISIYLCHICLMHFLLLMHIYIKWNDFFYQKKKVNKGRKMKPIVMSSKLLHWKFRQESY